jgi:hypothetical protein
VRVRGGGFRRLACAVAALPVLVAGCGWPGSDQVAAAVRCVVRPQTPPPADAPLPAVWRTHSVPGAGYSIALPDNWDGVALGGSDQREGRALTAVAERSPAIVGELRQRVSEGSLLAYGPPAYLAISTGGDRLDVGLSYGARYPISCAGAPFVDALSSADDPGGIRQAHFPAGDARVLTYQDHTVISGATESFTNWLFALGGPNGQDLLLLFSSHREVARAMWPVVWGAMRSLRQARPDAGPDGADPQPGCLYPDAPARELTAGRHALPCAIPLGRRLGEADCGPAPADPGRTLDSTILSRTGATDTPIDGRRLATSDCVFFMPANSAVWLGAGPVAADVVAYVDLRFADSGRPIASIDMRQGGSQALSGTITPGGGMFLTEYGVGRAAATSLSATSVLPSSGVHRLVLSAVGSRLHVWLDGRTEANAVTHVTQAGAAGIYLTTEDAAANVFDVLSAGVYAAG